MTKQIARQIGNWLAARGGGTGAVQGASAAGRAGRLLLVGMLALGLAAASACGNGEPTLDERAEEAYRAAEEMAEELREEAEAAAERAQEESEAAVRRAREEAEAAAERAREAMEEARETIEEAEEDM